jgi:hypothetical protein
VGPFGVVCFVWCALCVLMIDGCAQVTDVSQAARRTQSRGWRAHYTHALHNHKKAKRTRQVAAVGQQRERERVLPRRLFGRGGGNGAAARLLLGKRDGVGLAADRRHQPPHFVAIQSACVCV